MSKILDGLVRKLKKLEPPLDMDNPEEWGEAYHAILEEVEAYAVEHNEYGLKAMYDGRLKSLRRVVENTREAHNLNPENGFSAGAAFGVALALEIMEGYNGS